MKGFLFWIRKLQASFISWNKKYFLSGDYANMLCFVLGIYGERFFLYVYSLLRTISPEEFSFVCLIGTYCFIVKFIHG